MKLVIVMGVTWTADVLSWIAEVLSWGNDGDYFWYATDLVNALQGVLIFIVVGCQPQVRNFIYAILLTHQTYGENKNENRINDFSFLISSTAGFERSKTAVGLQKWPLHAKYNARSTALELIEWHPVGRRFDDK